MTPPLSSTGNPAERDACKQDRHDQCSAGIDGPCWCDNYGHPDHDSESDLLA